MGSAIARMRDSPEICAKRGKQSKDSLTFVRREANALFFPLATTMQLDSESYLPTKKKEDRLEKEREMQILFLLLESILLERIGRT